MNPIKKILFGFMICTILTVNSLAYPVPTTPPSVSNVNPNFDPALNPNDNPSVNRPGESFLDRLVNNVINNVLYSYKNKVKENGYNIYGKTEKEQADYTSKNEAIKNFKQFISLLNGGFVAMLIMVIALILVIKMGILGAVSQNATKRTDTLSSILKLLFAIAMLGGSGLFVSIIITIAISFVA